MAPDSRVKLQDYCDWLLQGPKIVLVLNYSYLFHVFHVLFHVLFHVFFHVFHIFLTQSLEAVAKAATHWAQELQMLHATFQGVGKGSMVLMPHRSQGRSNQHSSQERLVLKVQLLMKHPQFHHGPCFINSDDSLTMMIHYNGRICGDLPGSPVTCLFVMERS